MKKKFEINLKKIIVFYSLGFLSANFLPQNYFFSIMNKIHDKINDNLEVEDKGDFYKIN